MRKTISLTESNLRELILEEIQKFHRGGNVLNEKSLNRSIAFMEQHDIACLSAFRGKFENETDKTLDDRPPMAKETDEPYKYSKPENIRRNRDLKASLLKLGYGVTKIAGNYIENYNTPNATEVGEESYFIVNLNDDPDFYDNIFALSEYYNQDCFLYKPKGSEEAVNVGTNKGDWPGYGVEEPAGKLHTKVDNEFLSRIGNSSFSFMPDGSKPSPQKSNDFETRKSSRTPKDEPIETYESFNRNQRNVISNIHHRTMRRLNEMYNRK